MDNYEIIGGPEIQYFIDLDGFDENATLICENESMGIDDSTYLVNAEWMKKYV